MTLHRAFDPTRDLESVFAIYDDEVLHGTATFDTEPSTPERRQRWADAHAEPRYSAIVCEEAGKVVGWASLSRYSDRRAYDRTAETSTYVHRDFRGRGIGRGLLVRIIETARLNGLHVLLARITSESAPSLALHRSIGFRDVGTLHAVGEKFGRLLDVEILELSI